MRGVISILLRFTSWEYERSRLSDDRFADLGTAFEDIVEQDVETGDDK